MENEKASIGADYRKRLNDLEQEKSFLLALCNDITKVRQKNDLIALFKSKIKDKFYFTHIIITLVDRADETFTPFLSDNEDSAIRKDPRYQEIMTSRFSMDNPIIKQVLGSEESCSFDMEAIMHLSGMPPFFKQHFEKGARKVLLTRLIKAGDTIGLIHIYSDKANSFTPFFKRVMKTMAPLLSSAVSNIIKNQELIQKEQEKSVLLAFSTAIAKVRTKEELSKAITQSISRINKHFSFIIVRAHFEDQSLSTFCYHLDPGHQLSAVTDLLNQTDRKSDDGIASRILNSSIPLLFNVKREMKRGVRSDYLKAWQHMGETHFIALRLARGDVNQGFFLLNTEKINVDLLQSFCAQVSTAMANIVFNELVITKQKEQTYLLDFAREVTHIQNRESLKNAIFKILDGMIHTKLAMIRVLAEDRIHMIPFMYDPSLFTTDRSSFQKMSAVDISIDEPYTKEVLASQEGAVFNVEEELKKGNAYARLWKSTGLKNMYALPMRTQDEIIGTIWLLADKLNATLVKGLCAQISISISNVLANEKLLAYKKRLEDENSYLKEQIQSIYNFSEIIGKGPKMTEVYKLMNLVADTDTSVLILGETGTGKELIARAIHNASSRKEKLMVKVNCAALPGDLIESELFGHEKGAFTGAVDRRLGKFELAQNSTIFLDEIGELPLSSQAKLLRVLQEKEIERIGGKRPIPINVRIVTATNRDLEAEVRKGKFRADLYFRLNVFPILLPALKDRKEDIEPLTWFFIEKYTRATGRRITKLTSKALSRLQDYHWPGNVRELEHLIERSILLSPEGILDDIEIPQQPLPESDQAIRLNNQSLSAIERQFILQILRQCKGKISGPGGAAEVLQLPANTLHSRIKKLQIHKREYFT